MDNPKPTLGAKRRFEKLDEMIPAQVLFPGAGEDCEEILLDATVVDVSAGGMCLRLPVTADEADLMRELIEGDFVEVDVEESPLRRWKVLGHLAWIWVPSMIQDDTVGSLGVNIAGVIEQDSRWFGRLRGVLGRDREIEVDRTARVIEIPAKIRQQCRQRETGEGEHPRE